MELDLYQNQREEMVREQIQQRGIHQARLLEVLRRIPRHRFVPEHLASSAYWDGPLPIGGGQTISQPYIVALMTSLLQLKGEETVLEVGTGSGYQAAVLAALAREVHSLERHPSLAERAGMVLRQLNITNVSVHVGDGSLGYPPAAPYQGILITAAAPEPPPPLLEQLAEGGRLVVPVGGRGAQDLQVWIKENGHLDYETILPVAFVPLRGEWGWQETQWPA